MDDSVNPKTWNFSNTLWLLSGAREALSAPYHFRLDLFLCQSSKSFVDIIIVLSAFATHQELPQNIGFVFIQSDWNDQLYRRVWGTLLPSVDEDTNQSKSWYLPVQVMENKVQVWLCDNEGGVERWLLAMLLSLEVTFRRPARLWSSSQSCITCQCKHADQLLLFPDHLTQN